MLRLQQRKEFVRVAASGRKCVTRSLVMQAGKRPTTSEEKAAGLGFTCTKRLGGAVIRNRVRRRLKAAAQQLAPQLARPGQDYVIIGRQQAIDCPFRMIEEDMAYAFRRIHR